MIVNNIIVKVDIPHEPGEWIQFKKLSWKQTQEASDISSDALFDRMKKMGGDILSALKNMAQTEEKTTESKLDQATVLKYGILKWSYDAAVTNENINQLDSQTAEWAYNEIVKLNKPKTEEERKNA